MKKMTRLLIIAAMLMLPIYANAAETVTLTTAWTGPQGDVYFNDGYGGQKYTAPLDVDVTYGGVTYEAFCVDKQYDYVGNQRTAFTLRSIQSTETKYLKMAAIAEYFYTNYEGKSGEEAYKAGAQMAIWEYLYDNDAATFDYNSSTFDTLKNGNFRSAGNYYANSYNDEAVSVWNNAGASSGNWMLLTNATQQDFIVRTSPVPIPASLFLFGSGLMGLVGIRRKMMK